MVSEFDRFRLINVSKDTYSSVFLFCVEILQNPFEFLRSNNENAISRTSACPLPRTDGHIARAERGRAANGTRSFFWYLHFFFPSFFKNDSARSTGGGSKNRTLPNSRARACQGARVRACRCPLGPPRVHTHNSIATNYPHILETLY
jgi:hypothetical protein